MSLAYKIFKIPRTFEEFIDKSINKGVKKVDITPIRDTLSYVHSYGVGFVGAHDKGKVKFVEHNIYNEPFSVPEKVKNTFSSDMYAGVIGLGKDLPSLDEVGKVKEYVESKVSKLKENDFEVEVKNMKIGWIETDSYGPIGGSLFH